MASAAGGPAVFSQDFFHARAKVFAIIPKFFFYDLQGNKIGFLKRKWFTLKDIRLYTDESMAQELLTVKMRSIIPAFSATYEVVDAREQTKVGVLKRRAWSGMLGDLIIMDAADQDIGRIHEESAIMSLLRGFLLANLIPQSYVFEVGGQQVGTAKLHFNPFVLKMDVDLRRDSARKLDRRLAAAAVMLLLAIEGTGHVSG
ncbi:MAG: hypothetical protein ACRD2Y_11430 [Terriglobales bacterium]